MLISKTLFNFATNKTKKIMKRIKGKYIRLTEQQLNQIVKEAVERHVNMLMEYAIPRAKFIDNVGNLTTQMLENWCLVHYCTLTGRTMTKDHWKKELYAHMTNIGKKAIKGNNSCENRINAITEGFSQMDVPTTVERIDFLIGDKFIMEDIDIEDTVYAKCLEDCNNSIPSMINVLADGYYKNIKEYIETI